MFRRVYEQMEADPTCPPEEVQQSRSELSAAYCALAEVYLTELWCLASLII